ncbi:MAG: ribose-phosphate diphosphokinase, partial [Clostridia bacterium]|nr:ribose-phosphate diphosphokinase [Clostridia bacterium]
LNIPDLVVVSPDAGFAKTARKYAEYLDTDLVIGDKIRRAHDENAEICEVIGEVRDRNALIVDDFSLSGGTLVKMAEALKVRGARKVFVAITHLLLDEKGVQRIEASPIDLLVGMDTVDNERMTQSSKIRIISAAPLFAEALIRIQNEESLSSLFNCVHDHILLHSW